MTAMATALFGSPLALQIYLIAHARKSDIKISNFGWPVASLSSITHQSSSEQESARPNDNAIVKPTTSHFDPRSPDPPVMPRTDKATSVSYTAVGRGLYRREVTALEEAAERQLPTKVDIQELSMSADDSGQLEAKPNLYIARKLREIQQEPKRYALSAATATAISQSRNDRFRKMSGVSSGDSACTGMPRVSQLSTGPQLYRRDVQERKHSAALVALLPLGSISEGEMKFGGRGWTRWPDEAAFLVSN